MAWAFSEVPSGLGSWQPRPLYLVCGCRIGQVGATERPRPWSIKTAEKSLGRRATTQYESEPEQLPGTWLLVLFLGAAALLLVVLTISFVS